VTELARPGLPLECTSAAVQYEHDNGGVLLNSPMDEMPTYREQSTKNVAPGAGSPGARQPQFCDSADVGVVEAGEHARFAGEAGYRRLASCAQESGRTLTATSRPSLVSVAR
jgi:hypothetical protein